MTRISHRFETDCPPEKLWSALSDLIAVSAYNPGVTRARLVGSQSSSTGAMRECDVLPKGKVRERVIAWEEGKAVGIEVTESDWPITYMRWTTRLSPLGNGSRIDQDLDYGMKFGPLGWLLNQLVMRRTLEKNVGVALKGMIAHAESLK